MLNDVFVSGLPGLVPVHPQRSHVHCSPCVLRSAALMPLVGASCFPESFSVKCSALRFSDFSSKIPSVSSVNRVLSTGVSF